MTKSKRPRLVNIKTLENKVWKLCKEYVYLRDGSKCQKCGKVVSGHNRHPSHVIPKSRSLLLRYNDNNVKTMCMHHHRWWHLFPTESGKWFAKEFPIRNAFLERDKQVFLKDRLKETGKTKREWLEGWIKYYETNIGRISEG